MSNLINFVHLWFEFLKCAPHIHNHCDNQLQGFAKNKEEKILITLYFDLLTISRFLIFLICISVMPSWITAHHMHPSVCISQCSVSDPPRAWVTYSYEMSCGCWGVNLSPLESNKCSYPLSESNKCSYPLSRSNIGIFKTRNKRMQRNTVFICRSYYSTLRVSWFSTHFRVCTKFGFQCDLMADGDINA